MKSRKIEAIIVVFFVILVCAAFYFGLRNFSYFNVEEVEVSVSGPASSVSSDIELILNPIKGINLLELSIPKLKKDLLALEEVADVEIEKYYPNKLLVFVQYVDWDAKSYCIEETGEKQYFFIKGSDLVATEKNVWDEFDKLSIVELNPEYANMLLKWKRSDKGFISMVSLVKDLKFNNLITSIKYDNNNSNDFGRLILTLPSLNAVLYVRELVSMQRLEDAITVIRDQSSNDESLVVFDLYSNTLVKRTKEDV